MRFMQNEPYFVRQINAAAEAKTCGRPMFTEVVRGDAASREIINVRQLVQSRLPAVAFLCRTNPILFRQINAGFRSSPGSDFNGNLTFDRANGSTGAMDGESIGDSAMQRCDA